MAVDARDESGHGSDGRRTVLRSSEGEARVTRVNAPETAPLPSRFRVPEGLSEIVINRPGHLPVSRVLPDAEVKPAVIADLVRTLEDLPRIAIAPGQGGLDIKLEDPQGRHIKGGTVLLEGPGGTVFIPIDPITRRFRIGGLAPGVYGVRAASPVGGRGAVRIELRENDITRTGLQLDGSELEGTGSVRFALRGTEATLVSIRGIDTRSGRVIHESSASVEGGIVHLRDIPMGRIHWEIESDEERSCYESDVTDGSGLLDHIDIYLTPRPKIGPDPPDPEFGSLPFQFGKMIDALPELGITSLKALAASEPEALMHKAQDLHATGSRIAPLHGRLFADAIATARLLISGPHVFAVPSTKANIETIYRTLAEQNPGLGTNQPDAVMLPQNIQMWLDRARTLMGAAGVCSINDLGRFRLSPAPILRPGVYVAPLAKPTLKAAATLPYYEFAGILSDTILHYKPNDIFHETAVIMAGEWDLVGQSYVIGKEVRELVVIARSIAYNPSSQITWEMPALPPANAYWPSPAPAGRNGAVRGEHGEQGGHGDRYPHPSRNGGADAKTAAPIVTMFVLDTRNGLPVINLRGQQAGQGGRGQDGGRGGDGARGEDADGTVFGGCCRDAGFGGNGGRGGSAGWGGKGGRGGEGGKLTLLTSPASIAALAVSPPSIDLNPGEGGFLGLPGTPGEGGLGGPPGSAECEPWCDERPNRRGRAGTVGNSGALGDPGDPGPAPSPDAFQVLPITDQEWLDELNRPHILTLSVYAVEPDVNVEITGQNFDPAVHRVYFDGTNVGPVTSATTATFTVPITAEGGSHPVVVRDPNNANRRSNRAMLQILPQLDPIPPKTRWVENQNVTLTGLAFRPGLQLLAEDRSVAPPASFSLPVVGVTRTSINVQVPGGFLGGLRGVRRLFVTNPDGGRSQYQDHVVRIGDTIVVKCAAFRVVGMTAGIGTPRSEVDIAHLFAEGAVDALTSIWGQARIAFRLVQPVKTIQIRDDWANVWPQASENERKTFNDAPAVPGALNLFFVRDVETTTHAYAFRGGGPLFIGENGGDLFSPAELCFVVAHEMGHAICLEHVCSIDGEPGTLFNRSCQDSDKAFLMYPTDAGGNAVPPAQITQARSGATHFEDGKTAKLATSVLFQGSTLQCTMDDEDN